MLGKIVLLVTGTSPCKRDGGPSRVRHYSPVMNCSLPAADQYVVTPCVHGNFSVAGVDAVFGAVTTTSAATTASKAYETSINNNNGG